MHRYAQSVFLVALLLLLPSSIALAPTPLPRSPVYPRYAPLPTPTAPTWPHPQYPLSSAGNTPQPAQRQAVPPQRHLTPRDPVLVDPFLADSLVPRDLNMVSDRAPGSMHQLPPPPSADTLAPSVRAVASVIVTAFFIMLFLAVLASAFMISVKRRARLTTAAAAHILQLFSRPTATATSLATLPTFRSLARLFRSPPRAFPDDAETPRMPQGGRRHQTQDWHGSGGGVKRSRSPMPPGRHARGQDGGGRLLGGEGATGRPASPFPSGGNSVHQSYLSSNHTSQHTQVPPASSSPDPSGHGWELVESKEDRRRHRKTDSGQLPPAERAALVADALPAPAPGTPNLSWRPLPPQSPSRQPPSSARSPQQGTLQLDVPLDFSTVAAMAERSAARRASHRPSPSIGAGTGVNQVGVGGASYSKALTGERRGSGGTITSTASGKSVPQTSGRQDIAAAPVAATRSGVQVPWSPLRDGTRLPRSTPDSGGAGGPERRNALLPTPPMTPGSSQSGLSGGTSTEDVGGMVSGTTSTVSALITPLLTITPSEDIAGGEGGKGDRTRRRRHRRTGKSGSGSHPVAMGRKGPPSDLSGVYRTDDVVDGESTGKAATVEVTTSGRSHMLEHSSGAPRKAGAAIKPRSVSMSAGPRAAKPPYAGRHFEDSSMQRLQPTPPPSPPSASVRDRRNSAGQVLVKGPMGVNNSSWGWQGDEPMDFIEEPPHAMSQSFSFGRSDVWPNHHFLSEDLNDYRTMVPEHTPRRYLLGSDHALLAALEVPHEPERGRSTYYSPFATGVDFGLGPSGSVEEKKMWDDGLMSLDTIPVDIYGRDIAGGTVAETVPVPSRYPGSPGRFRASHGQPIGSPARSPPSQQSMYPASPGRQAPGQTWNTSLLLDVTAPSSSSGAAGGARSPELRARQQRPLNIPMIDTSGGSPVDDVSFSYINNLLSSPVTANAPSGFFDGLGQQLNGGGGAGNFEKGALSHHPLLLEERSSEPARSWAGTLLQRVSGASGGASRSGATFEPPLMMGMRRSYDDPNRTEQGYSLFG
ncbi:hypothetical protein M427DRAFT_38934 [Gonapodya prolifera JEL478]|uniref:Proteophosphoglycan ppg4 n=1 Tax=Gonapodya prolifera (strain JEL478) TaxID=1344416 RepID=A0A138ZY22_GONPJ|nr:hypothetical protein M427DRAFT_38934 [Gonapodya prolifera JEL478]|eukprot:KXS09396.1 hypothetical protein M427DRAFT_38934 [Gonapodya prolifera JEL478]